MVDRDAACRQLRTFFEGSLPDVSAAWLFGSTARGTATERSDVDVAVLMAGHDRGGIDKVDVKTDAVDNKTDAVDVQLHLERDLERVLRCKVDVVVVNTAPVDLVHRILRDGILFLERDRSARIRFEVRSRNEYFDLAPVLQQYRRFSGGEP
jgi:predicted nucleotidyltransferase